MERDAFRPVVLNQVLNLSICGSHQQLITRLKLALKSQANRVGCATPIRPGRSTCRKEHTNAASTTAQPTDLNTKHDSNLDDNSSLLEDGSPSLDDLLSLQDHSALPPAVGSALSPADTPFGNGQLCVLQQTVQAAVQNACIQQETPTSLNILRLQFAMQACLHLSVFNGLWTALWRKKSCGVSMLNLHCFNQFGRKCDVTFLLFLRKYAKIIKNNREKLGPNAKSLLPVSRRNIRGL